jgi:hypothetical protein
VALAFDVTLFPVAIIFMVSMYYLTWRALRGAFKSFEPRD